MAAFLRSVLKKPHVKPLLWNCTTYGLLYGGAEFTQQSKAKYYDVSLCFFYFPISPPVGLMQKFPIAIYLFYRKILNNMTCPKWVDFGS